jgi:hypothetical protein
VQLKRLYPGKLRKDTEIQEGFIITHVDKQAIKSIQQLTQLLEKKTGGVMLEGIYPDRSGTHYYAFGLDS